MQDLTIRTRPDHGAVTAETAVALPVLLLVAWLVLALLSVGAAQLACQDAARVAARAAARGEPASVVVDTATHAGPAGAKVSLDEQGDLVVVEVESHVRWAGPLPLPSFTVRGRAVAAPEQPTP